MFFAEWYSWAIRSRLEPVNKVARMMKRHLPNIVSYCKHRITNAALEGINNKIQSLIKKATVIATQTGLKRYTLPLRRVKLVSGNKPMKNHTLYPVEPILSNNEKMLCDNNMLRTIQKSDVRVILIRIV